MQHEQSTLKLNEWSREKHHRLYVEQAIAGKYVRLGYIDLKRGEATDEYEALTIAQALADDGRTLNEVLLDYADNPHEEDVPAIFPELKQFVVSGHAGAQVPTAYRLYFDGGAEPTNPGDGFGSYAIFACDSDGRFTAQHEPPVLTQFGKDMTNNIAEYLALISGLEALTARLLAAGVKLKDCALDVWGDSNLVVQQVAGNWGVATPHLHLHRQRAAELCDRFAYVRLSHHYRVFSMIVLGH